MKKQKGDMVNIAHRGLHGHYPENSYEAIRGAIGESGVDAIEIDVRTTRDHQPAVFHDRRLVRLLGQVGDIRHIFWDTLKKKNILQGNQQGIHIPHLEQIMELVKGKKQLIIEVKDYDLIMLDNITSILNRYPQASEWVTIQSFRSEVLCYFQKNEPQFDLYKIDILRIPFTNYFVGRYFDVHHVREYAGLAGVSMPALFLNRWDVSFLKKMKLELLCWGISKITRAQNIHAIGVSNLITDIPKKVNAYLRNEISKD